MKPWMWVLLAGSAIVVIVVIAKSSQPANGAVNNNLTAAAGLGGLLAGLLKGGNKVSAPAATAGSLPGDTGYSYNGLSGQQYGAGYSAAMGGTGYAASESAGGGGGFGPTTAGAGAAYSAAAPGYSASESAGSGFLGNGGANPGLGVGQLTAPSFDIGTSGADFSN